MGRNGLRESSRILAGLMTGLMVAILCMPAGAQRAAEGHPFYDISREVTLNGTVSSVLTRGSSGMIMGSHLLLATSAGEVDASLGRWGLSGKNALSVRAGQQVEVTGVMKTFGDRQVFVVRTVKVGGRAYPIRNEHGIPVSPQARERGSRRTVQNGGSL
jgi:hypothetical protein